MKVCRYVGMYATGSHSVGILLINDIAPSALIPILLFLSVSVSLSISDSLTTFSCRLGE